MNELQVALFGKFCVQFGGCFLEGLEVQKAQELFCYLLLHRDQHYHRDKLATVLWGDDCSTNQAKAYLRKALWQLQQALSSLPMTADCPVLLVDADWLALNSEFPLWLDTAVFEQAHHLVKGKAPHEINQQTQRLVEEAIHLYRGDFLEGWYQEWCIYERERFEYMYLNLLDKLMQQCEYNQTYEKGVSYGQLILHHDEAREHTHYHLMRLYYLAGYRVEALRQYHRCTTILHEELGVDPSHRTQTLYQALQADNLEQLVTLTDDGRHANLALNQTLHHLEKAKKLLDHMQTEIQREIDDVLTIINKASHSLNS